MKTLYVYVCAAILIAPAIALAQSIKSAVPVVDTTQMMPIPNPHKPKTKTSSKVKPKTKTSSKVKWVQGVGQSCAQICNHSGMNALESGIYMPLAQGGKTKAAHFYVCAANAQAEGWRTGYNTSTGVWQTSCVVGWGGQETFVTPYKCLCSK